MSDSTTSDQFQQRRALDLAIEALGKTNTEAELVQGAYAIVDEFPPAMVTAAMLKRLDTPSSQLRGGLARVATFLPAEETLKTLQEYALNRANPPQGRVTAAMIVERFLGGALRPGSLSDLQGNEDAAVQSLYDAVSEGEDFPEVLVDYTSQMQQYGPEIAMQVMSHLDALEPEMRVNLLRLITFDRRPQVARAALARLENLAQFGDAAFPQEANARGSNDARRALYVLVPNLPPDLAKSAEGVLRKLQFRGTVYVPVPDAWRCFLGLPFRSSATPIEFWGYDPFMHDDQRFGALLQQDRRFVGASLESEQAPTGFGRMTGIGEVVLRDHEDGSVSRFVRIPNATGRLLLQRGVRRDLENGMSPPGEYLACFHLIWDVPREPDDAAVATWLDGDGERIDLVEGERVARTLLNLPGMASWDLAETLRKGMPGKAFFTTNRQETLRRFRTLVKDQAIDKMLAPHFEAALRYLALWLHYAGDEENARNARNLAVSQVDWPLDQNPLIDAMFVL